MAAVGRQFIRGKNIEKLIANEYIFSLGRPNITKTHYKIKGLKTYFCDARGECPGVGDE